MNIMKTIKVSLRTWHSLVIMQDGNDFEAIILDEATKDVWKSTVFGLNRENFAKLEKCSWLGRTFLEITEKKVVYHGGLHGGGSCLGSKHKVVDSRIIKKTTNFNVLDKSGKSDEKAEMFNGKTEKIEEKIERNVEIALGNTKEISSDVEAAKMVANGLKIEILDKKYLDQLFKSDVLRSLYPYEVVSILLRNIKLNNWVKNLENFQEKKKFFLVIKRFLMCGIAGEQDTRTLEISENLIVELEKVNLFFESQNKLRSTIHPFFSLSLILDIIKNLTNYMNRFKGIIKNSFSTKTIPKYPIYENSQCIKYFFISIFAEKQVYITKNIENELNQDIKLLKTFKALEIFEIFNTCRYLNKKNLLSNEFLFSHFLNFSSTAESEQTLIRQISVFGLRKLKKSKNLMFSDGITSLLSQLHTQESNPVIKSEISLGLLKNTQEMITGSKKYNNEFLPFMSGRLQEVEKIREGLKEFHFFGIFGEIGTGKTTLANYYSYKYQKLYHTIQFINTEQPELELFDLAGKLSIPSSPETLKLLTHALNNPNFTGKLLLVFDSSDDLSKIEKFLIKNEKIDVLLITRNPVWKNSVSLNNIESDEHEFVIQSLFYEKMDSDDLESLKKIFGCWVLGAKFFGSLTNLRCLKDLSMNESKEDLVKRIILDFYSTLSQHVRVLIEIITYLSPYCIPERVLYKVFTEKFSKTDWLDAKSLLLNKNVIKIQGLTSTSWTIHDFLYSVFIDLPKSFETSQKLTDFFYLEYCSSQTSGKLHELTFHVQQFIYQCDLNSAKELQIGLCLIENLLLIENQKNIVKELIEVFEEKTKTLFQTENKEILKIFKRLAEFCEVIQENEYSLEIYEVYQEELTKIMPGNQEIYELTLHIATLAESTNDYERADSNYNKCISLSK